MLGRALHQDVVVPREAVRHRPGTLERVGGRRTVRPVDRGERRVEAINALRLVAGEALVDGVVDDVAGACRHAGASGAGRVAAEEHDQGQQQVAHEVSGWLGGRSVPHAGIVVTVARPRRWTAADDLTLTWMWEHSATAKIARKLGRSSAALRARAYKLGLGIGLPRGAETVQQAADRCGINRKLMVRVLAFAGVRARRTHVNTDFDRRRVTQRRWKWLLPEEADRAMTAWMATENLTAAALSRGVSRYALELRVRRDHAVELVQWGRETRVPTTVIEAVCAELAATKRRGPPRRAR